MKLLFRRWCGAGFPYRRRPGRTFETAAAGLLDLLAWLTECRCTHVAMEAAGVYWKPVWNSLSDGDFDLIPSFARTANARHIRNVPGRETDMNDAMWIAECGRRLTAHTGPLRGPV